MPACRNQLAALGVVVSPGARHLMHHVGPDANLRKTGGTGDRLMEPDTLDLAAVATDRQIHDVRRGLGTGRRKALGRTQQLADVWVIGGADGSSPQP